MSNDEFNEIDGGLQLNGELQSHHVWTRIETVITAADLWTYLLREFVMPDPYRNPPDDGDVFTDTRAVVSEYLIPFDEFRYIETETPNPNYDPDAPKNPANPLYDKSKISPFLEMDVSGLEIGGVYPRRTLGVKVDGVTIGFNANGELVASSTLGPLCNPVGGIVYLEEGLTIAYGGGLGITLDEDTGLGLLAANVDWETIGINDSGQLVAAPPTVTCNPLGGIVYTTDGLTIFSGAGLAIVQEETTQLGMLIASTDGNSIGFNEQGQLVVNPDVLSEITSCLQSISDIVQNVTQLTGDIAEITGNIAEIMEAVEGIEAGIAAMVAAAGLGAGAVFSGLGDLISAFTGTDADGNKYVDGQALKRLREDLTDLQEDVEGIASDIQSLEQFCYAAQIVIGDHADRIEALEESMGTFTVEMTDAMSYIYEVHQYSLNMQRHLVTNTKITKAVFEAIANRLAIIETQIANAETVDYLWMAIGNLQRHTITNARTSEKRLRAIEERVLKVEDRALKAERDNRRLRKVLHLH